MHAGLLALSLVLSQVPPIPLPCAPSDSTVVCGCKQGSESACAALAEGDAEALKAILRLAATVKAADELQKATVSVDTGCGVGQSPQQDDDQAKCTGQEHHIISMTVWKALERHRVLRGLYRYRDPRFVAQAKDLKAHCGWQGWHRNTDAEIADWLERHRDATAEQFAAYLREVFSRPELRLRFPNGF